MECKETLQVINGSRCPRPILVFVGRVCVSVGLCIHVCELNNAGKLLWAKKQIEKVHLTGWSKSLLADAVLGVGLGQRGLHRQDSRPALPTCRLAAVRRAHLHALGRTAGGLTVPTRYFDFFRVLPLVCPPVVFH